MGLTIIETGGVRRDVEVLVGDATSPLTVAYFPELAYSGMRESEGYPDAAVKPMREFNDPGVLIYVGGTVG